MIGLKTRETLYEQNYLILDRSKNNKPVAIVKKHHINLEEDYQLNENTFEGIIIDSIDSYGGNNREWYFDYNDENGYSIYWAILETEHCALKDAFLEYPEYFL